MFAYILLVMYMQISRVYKLKNMICGVLLTTVFGALFIIYSAQARVGIISGITACVTVVIPSMYPFMALCSFFDISGGAPLINKLFKYLPKVLMGRYSPFFSQYLLSLIGGYPVGAASLNTLVKKGVTDADTAKKVLMFSVNTSPAFVILAVGEGMLYSKKIGWILFGVNLLTSFITMVAVTRFAPLFTKKSPYIDVSKNTENSSLDQSFVTGVVTASRSLLFMCGFVVLFFALNEMASYMPFPQLTVVISILGEITSSCAVMTSGEASLPLIASMLSFGGLCVHFQIMSVAKDFRPKFDQILTVQTVKAIISYILMCFLQAVFPEIINLRAEQTLSNMTSPGEMGFSVPPITAVCLVLTALSLLYYMINLTAKKEKLSNEKC